jgi:hypothetical protein
VSAVLSERSHEPAGTAAAQQGVVTVHQTHAAATVISTQHILLVFITTIPITFSKSKSKASHEWLFDPTASFLFPCLVLFGLYKKKQMLVNTVFTVPTVFW